MQIDAESIKNKVERLAEKYQLELVVLFGSQVTGKTHSKSDVDIAFYAPYVMRLAELAGMQLDFSHELAIKELELVDLKSASPLLLKQVADQSHLLYEKGNSTYDNFRLYALRRYRDAKPLFILRQHKLDKFLGTYGK